MRSAEGHDLPSLEPGILGSPAVTGKDEIPAAQSNTELNVVSGRALLQSHDRQGGTASCTMGGVTALPPLPLHSRSARGNKLPVRLGKTEFVLVDGLTVRDPWEHLEGDGKIWLPRVFPLDSSVVSSML